LKDYDGRYVFSRIGYNVRMTDPVAAFGIEQLKKLDAFNAQRIETAASYSRQLEPFGDWLQTPTVPPGCVHTYYTYPLVVRPQAPFRRAELTRYLEARHVETRALFGGSLADQPAFRELGLRVVGELPVTRAIRDRCFFIGCHPRIGEAQRAYVIQCFQEFVAQRAEAGARIRTVASHA
jgi:CDP-6-deoxy-D-xylo-4-hexulose-3-dehydrase